MAPRRYDLGLRPPTSTFPQRALSFFARAEPAVEVLLLCDWAIRAGPGWRGGRRGIRGSAGHLPYRGERPTYAAPSWGSYLDTLRCVRRHDRPSDAASPNSLLRSSSPSGRARPARRTVAHQSSTSPRVHALSPASADRFPVLLSGLSAGSSPPPQCSSCRSAPGLSVAFDAFRLAIRTGRGFGPAPAVAARAPARTLDRCLPDLYRRRRVSAGCVPAL